MKTTPLRSRAIRESARGKPCTVRSPVCNGRSETTVWAHSNFSFHGKALGRKADDIFGCYACSSCHAWLDEGHASHDEKAIVFFAAFSRSLSILITEGIVNVK